MKKKKNDTQKLNMTKKASDFYKKYNIPLRENEREILKPNGNFKYIWDMKAESNINVDLSTSIY